MKMQKVKQPLNLKSNSSNKKNSKRGKIQTRMIKTLKIYLQMAAQGTLEDLSKMILRLAIITKQILIRTRKLT